MEYVGWNVVEYVGFLEELVGQVCPHNPRPDWSLDSNGQDIKNKVAVIGGLNVP